MSQPALALLLLCLPWQPAPSLSTPEKAALGFVKAWVQRHYEIPERMLLELEETVLLERPHLSLAGRASLDAKLTKVRAQLKRERTLVTAPPTHISTKPGSGGQVVEVSIGLQQWVTRYSDGARLFMFQLKEKLVWKPRLRLHLTRVGTEWRVSKLLMTCRQCRGANTCGSCAGSGKEGKSQKPCGLCAGKKICDSCKGRLQARPLGPPDISRGVSATIPPSGPASTTPALALAAYGRTLLLRSRRIAQIKIRKTLALRAAVRPFLTAKAFARPTRKRAPFKLRAPRFRLKTTGTRAVAVLVAPADAEPRRLSLSKQGSTWVVDGWQGPCKATRPTCPDCKGSGWKPLPPQDWLGALATTLFDPAPRVPKPSSPPKQGRLKQPSPR